MDRELRSYTSINCFCNGTTAVTMGKQGKNLVIGNIGNYRAMLARGEDDSLTVVQLTVDLKPNLPVEAERIRKCKGRVFSLQDEPDAARVWMPNNYSPGLAMTRAFGDFRLKDFGGISVPEISYRPLSEKDEFIVLARDWVWDVLSNDVVVKIVDLASSHSSTARSLVEEAFKPGRSCTQLLKFDDSAAAGLFLDSNPNYSSTKDKEKTFFSMETSEVGNDMDGSSSSPALNHSSTVREGEEVSAST